MKQLILLFLLTLATNSIAAINQFGDLSWDTSTDYIVNSRYNKMYVQFDLIRSFTTQEILDLTSPGNIYEDFHIANSTEAFEFLNAAVNTNHVNDTSAVNVYSGDINNGTYIDNMFGASLDSNSDYIFYYGDLPDQLGQIQLKAFNQDYQIHDYVDVLSSKDTVWSRVSLDPANAAPWLLVSDAQASVVPEPKAAFMLAIGLGVVSLISRKAKSKSIN